MIELKDFVGNNDLISLLRLTISAAKARKSMIPHLLLKGPAGTGKTTLAEAIAREFGVRPMALTPTTAKKPEDLRKVFLSMPGEGYNGKGEIIGPISPQIIFIDEIHQLSLLAQENLGIAMQDWRLPVRVNNKDVFEWVPRFTLIGATTLPGKLSKPFLDRFKIQSEFETYTQEEAETITKVHAQKQELELEAGVESQVAKRSRGVARLIVRFLDRLADAATVSGSRTSAGRLYVTQALTQTVFEKFLKIDDRGLTKTDLKILRQLAKNKSPQGVDTLAVITNEDKQTIAQVVEPYLVQEGLIIRTSRGRILSEEGLRYLISCGYISGKANPTGRLV